MTGSTWAWLSFRRIVDVPFRTCVAALDSGQLTRPDGGPGLVRGPAEHDPDSGTYRLYPGASRQQPASRRPANPTPAGPAVKSGKRLYGTLE